MAMSAPEPGVVPDGAPLGRPDGPPRLPVVDMARSLGFYLGLGCEVGTAADGWALLRCGEASFVLLHAGAPGPGWRARSQWGRRAAAPLLSPSRVRLPTPDIRALRRRLLAAGVPASIVRPPYAPGGEMEVTDPDRHVVVIEQSGPPPATPHDADGVSTSRARPRAVPSCTSAPSSSQPR